MNFNHNYLASGIAEIVLRLDEHDLRDVLEAMRYRAWHSGLPIPDAIHDDANGNARIIAEICRSYMEQRATK